MQPQRSSPRHTTPRPPPASIRTSTMSSVEMRLAAIKLGLEDIDENLQLYTSQVEANSRVAVALQRERLSAVAERNALEVRDTHDRVSALGGEKFRDWLMGTVDPYRRPEYGNFGNGMFKWGSAMLTTKYLEKIGYVRSEPAPETPDQASSNMKKTYLTNLSIPEDQSVSRQEYATSPDFSRLTEGERSAAEGTVAEASNKAGVQSAIGQTGPLSWPKNSSSQEKSVRNDIPATIKLAAQKRGGPMMLNSTQDEAASNPVHPQSHAKVDPQLPTAQRQSRVFNGQVSAGSRLADIPGYQALGAISLITPKSPSIKDQAHLQRVKRPAQSPATIPAPKRQKPLDGSHAQDSSSHAVDASPNIQQPGSSSEKMPVAQSTLQGMNDLPVIETSPPTHVGHTTDGPPVSLSRVRPRPKHTIALLTSPGCEAYTIRTKLLRTAIAQMSSTCFSLTEAGRAADPAVVEYPADSLKDLYKVMFCRNNRDPWKDGANPVLRDVLDGNMLLEGIIGAAVYDKVFTKPVPWSSPIDLIQRIQEDGHAPYLKDAADQTSGLDFDLEFFIYRAAQLKAYDPQFQNSTIRPIARRLSADILITLMPQFKVLEIERVIDKPDTKAREALWNQISADLTDIVTQALIIRGMMHAARDEYQLVWVPGGSPYDSERMFAIPPASEKVGEMAFCVVPGILFRASPTEDWCVTSQAIGYRKVKTVG